MNNVSKFGIIVATIMLIIGIFLPVPKKEINTWASADNGGYEEYVGGDAYNIQIEASLRGGIIAGRTVAKTVLITVGVMVLFLSLALQTIIEKMNTNKSPIKSNDTSPLQEKSTEHLSKEYSPKYDPPVVKNVGNTWTCPECGKVNPTTQRICKDCGHEK